MTAKGTSEKAHSSTTLRAGLVALMAAGIVLFAMYETGAISKLPALGRLFAPRSAGPNVPVLAGSKRLRAYRATFNGSDSQFAHYSSPLSPAQVAEEYKQLAGGSGRTLLPGLQNAGPGHAMIGYIDRDGSTVGVVAFANRDGGSTYFAGRTQPVRQAPGGADVPGREPPGVPRPLRSNRVMCVENLAGLPSILSLYEGWGEIDDSVELIRAGMDRAGWQRNLLVEDAVNEKLPGRMLSYTRGVENCLIHIEREPATNHVATTMFYSQKPWLPEGRGF